MILVDAPKMYHLIYSLTLPALNQGIIRSGVRFTCTFVFVIFSAEGHARQNRSLRELKDEFKQKMEALDAAVGGIL